MDVVKTFNSELSSLYEVKPPISKAKMTQITKSAIKGIKFYKHIVQSVEKFIQKCRPEYKVPGLYVVDSIVRQSRHQFGSDKDVFGPRFVKNITTTFQHLFRCSEEDRPKIIRVLNLWQKNNVFPIDVIQPLLDMGHPNTSNEFDAAVDVPKESPVKVKEEPRHKSSDSWKGWPQNVEESVQEKTYAEMSTKNLEKFNKVEMSNALKEEEASRSSMFKNQVKVEKTPEETVKFNKKLLDFDYGDEDDEEVKNEDSHLSTQPNALALSISQNLLSNPELLRKIHEMAASTAESMGLQSHQPKQEDEANYSQDMQNSPQLQTMQNLPYTEVSSLLQFQFDKNGVPYQTQPSIPIMEPLSMDAAYPPMMPPDPHLMQNNQGDEDERVMYSMPGEPPLPPQDFDERQIILPDQERSRKDRSRSRSGSRTRRSGRRRSRSRSPRRKRSRSRSHSRKNRSRSREKEKMREKEREREKDRERRRKGIPPIKKGCVSVCSTTLWLGHVPKSCSEIDISNTFGEFGTILSIDMIPPRGCAYVVMDRRQDGYKALQRLKNCKLQGSNIKMAWAPGKGVKGKEYKDFWEVDLGVSYIPYDKIKEDPEALDFLEEGGFIDEDSLPEHLKALRKKPDDEKHLYNASKPASEINASVTNIQTAPNMVPPPVMPPTSVGIPMVLPHLMQPQFGLPLPGMLPPQAMMMQVPMGIPPPAPVLMVQQQSQGILSNQPLPVVGGVPQIVPRTIPPATTALPNIKSTIQTESVLPSAATPSTTTIGDATPTEEEGTNVSSPSVQMSLSGNASLPTIPSSQPVSTMAQFNSILGLNANRSMLTLPPPVSTTGTPIPFPPPNLGFNFPPPGIRPPGQAHSLPPNPQFPWMQKQIGSPFADADSSQSTTPVRPVPPPQPGMPVHMFSNRPPFHDSQSSNLSSTPVKESLKGRDNNEQKSGDIEGGDNRNMSPGHHDKMVQEMAISTDDESSMDIEYSRNEITPGPCFPGLPDFPRTPLNMRMRGPPGPMPTGPRFRGMPMGSPFPMRMGGPRGMGAPGMHNRMDMEYPPHHGSRGPRMPMGPHGPRRNDMHPSHDGRDWYPRDYEGPPFDRERRFRDDWNRDSWDHEGDQRRNSRDQDESRRDDHRDSWSRERPDNARSSRDNVSSDKSDSSGRPRDRPNKGKSSKSLMDDLLKLRGLQRGAPLIVNKPNRNEQSKDKPLKKDEHDGEINDIQKSESSVDQSNKDLEKGNEQSTANKKEKDRESRKRSRWGRTLSEERELQQKRNTLSEERELLRKLDTLSEERELQQKRNEIELKFQSYAAQQPVENTSDIPLQNSEEPSNQQPVDDQVDLPESNAHISLQNIVAVQYEQNELNMPLQTDNEMPVQTDNKMPVQTDNEMPFQTDREMSVQTDNEMPVDSEMPVQTDNEMIIQNESKISLQNEGEMPVQNESEMPVQKENEMLVRNESEMLVRNESEMLDRNESEMLVRNESEMLVRNEQPLIQDECETPVLNYREPIELTDSKISSDLCTNSPHSEILNSSIRLDDDKSETNVTENKSTSVCIESADIDMNNSVTNSNSNENFVETEDAITNNTSLVSTES